MSDNHAFAFDVCRRYIADNSDRLGDPEVVKTISGWLRSRSLKSLATVTDQFPSLLEEREPRRVLMQIEAFFKKNAVYSDPDYEVTTIRTFERGERLCRITNRRLDWYMTRPDRLSSDRALLIARMQRYIASVLGPFRDFLNALPEEVQVSSGATATRPKSASMRHRKMSLRPFCTVGAVPYLQALSSHFGYDELRPRLIAHNRLEVVPKNWKTGRTIACEPEGNMFLQLAFDSYAKRKLSRRGIDLSDQSKNQELAKLASHGEYLATIDLSMASDTLSYNTVALLLPQDWFSFLSDIRCKIGRLGGRSYKYAKFSSMGNGATFPLETLVFAAACEALGSVVYSVYGDDIIIEKDNAESLYALLGFLGFIPNEDKSFVSGPFKESCGVNYFRGIDITPFYLREVDRRKAVKSHNVNGLAQISNPGGELEAYLAKFVAKNNLPLVPFSENTMQGVHITVYDAYRTKKIRKHPTKPYVMSAKVLKPKTKTKSVVDLRASFLWHLACHKRATCPPEAFHCSTYTQNRHKYLLLWEIWNPPVVVTPVRLYGWSDLITRSLPAIR